MSIKQLKAIRMFLIKNIEQEDSNKEEMPTIKNYYKIQITQKEFLVLNTGMVEEPTIF